MFIQIPAVHFRSKHVFIQIPAVHFGTHHDEHTSMIVCKQEKINVSMSHHDFLIEEIARSYHFHFFLEKEVPCLPSNWTVPITFVK